MEKETLMNNMEELIVVTKYFGYNFTGATLSTHELIKQWSKYFKNITVVTRNVGKYDIDNIDIIKCKNNVHVLKVLKQLKVQKNNPVVYSDDHTGFTIKLAGLDYYHTYHANWPECRWVDREHFIKSFGFIPMYKLTLSNAKSVIAVSHFSKHFIKKYNNNISIIRNGIGRNRLEIENEKNSISSEKVNILMVGSIDKRKYLLAQKLFSKMFDLKDKISINIYGNILDESLANKLSKYEFVNVQGFNDNIEFESYDLYISTSKTENLSIAICEALKANIPVITFDIGGLSEVINNGENGFLVKRFSIDEMKKLIEMIAFDDYSFDYSTNKLEEFNWEYSSKRYLQEFKIRRML